MRKEPLPFCRQEGQAKRQSNRKKLRLSVAACGQRRRGQEQLIVKTHCRHLAVEEACGYLTNDLGDPTTFFNNNCKQPP